MKIKYCEITELVENLEKAGLIYKPSLQGNVITNYDGVVKKEAILSSLKNWGNARISDYEGYKNLTNPFKALSPYTSFEGKSQVFSNSNMDKELCELLRKKANSSLLPFIHYPYRSTASIHYFQTGAGKETYCLVKELDEIVNYWTLVIEELFSRISEKDCILYEMGKHPILVEERELYGEKELEIRWGKFNNYRNGESYKSEYIDKLKMVCEQFPEIFEVKDLRQQPNKAKIKVELLSINNTQKVVTKNGLDDYEGEALFLLSSQAGGWFMYPKGGFDGVANPDTYQVSKCFKVKISIY